ncbi:MAG: hypothetical protein ACRCYD_15090 [Plesiomonas sp.]
MSNLTTNVTSACGAGGGLATAAMSPEHVIAVIGLCFTAASVAIAGFNVYVNYRKVKLEEKNSGLRRVK